MGCKYARKTQENIHSFRLFGVICHNAVKYFQKLALVKELGNRNFIRVCIRLHFACYDTNLSITALICLITQTVK